MTDLLKDTMTERVDSLGDPDLDVLRMVRDGNRQVARRRTKLLGAGVAAAAVLAIALPRVLPDGEPKAADVASDIAPVAVVYAVGGTIHEGSETIETGLSLRALVQGSTGYVVSDAEGVVSIVRAGETTAVGNLVDADHPAFKSDGDLVTWIDAAGGGSITALELSTGERVGIPLSEWPGEATVFGASGELGAAAQVTAVDGGDVYVTDRRGVLVWDALGSGDTRLIPARKGADVEIQDVENGLIAYNDLTDDVDEIAVGTDLTSGRKFDAYRADLSADGRYFFAETSDENYVYDVTTGERLPFDKGDYAFLVGYRWLDADTYAGIALPTLESENPDLMTCETTTGSCVRTVEQAGEVESGLILPNVSW